MIKDIGELLAAEAEAAEAHRGAVRAATPDRSTACASPVDRLAKLRQVADADVSSRQR